MPSVIRNLKIVTLNASAIVQTGDALILAPGAAQKTFGGSGSFTTGDVPFAETALNVNWTCDRDRMDNSARKKTGP